MQRNQLSPMNLVKLRSLGPVSAAKIHTPSTEALDHFLAAVWFVCLCLPISAFAQAMPVSSPQAATDTLPSDPWAVSIAQQSAAALTGPAFEEGWS